MTARRRRRRAANLSCDELPSTAHRAEGSKVGRSKVVSSQRQCSSGDSRDAPELLPPLPGRQTALRGRPRKYDD
jgi:hypothetical protein